MLLIPCPHCGERPELEFAYGGEANLARRPELSDADWAQFLYARANVKGAQRERWRHVHGCGRVFTVVRDTVSDRFL